MESGKWKMENEKLKIENGKWKVLLALLNSA